MCIRDRNYTVRDGMTDNTVNALATDKQGNIWVGTRKGVSKYDGKAFRHFVFQSPENPNANAVSNIEIGNDGTAWCIAGNKLYEIKDGKSKSLAIPNKDANVTSVLPDGKNLWVAVANGTIYNHHDGRWDSLRFNEPQLIGIPQVLSLIHIYHFRAIHFIARHFYLQYIFTIGYVFKNEYTILCRYICFNQCCIIRHQQYYISGIYRFAICIIPVSYTHLDVYKRQKYDCNALLLSNTRE